MAEPFADDWWSGNRHYLVRGHWVRDMAEVRYGSYFDRERWTKAVPPTITLGTHGTAAYHTAPSCTIPQRAESRPMITFTCSVNDDERGEISRNATYTQSPFFYTH